MNFDEMSFKELENHAMERLVFGDEVLSTILKGHIYIEKVLESLITANLVRPNALFRSTRSFDLKTDLAFAMGLIDEKYHSAFKAINKVRNNYAHKYDYKVTFSDLNSFKFDWADIQNHAYKKACDINADKAASIATIFLCWKATLLIKNPE